MARPRSPRSLVSDGEVTAGGQGLLDVPGHAFGPDLAMVAREHSCLVEENSLWIPTGLYTIDSESGSQKLLGSPEPGIQSGASDGDPEESRGTLLQQGRGPVQGQAFCSRDR